MNTNNLIAGFGGAIVLTLLNETFKNVDEKMPRIDLVGEDVIQKTASFFGVDFANKEALYGTALLTDIVSNTAYYSLINGQGNDLWLKAASSGLVAGVAAIKIPEKTGIDDSAITKSNTTKALTIAYYTLGALASATILKLLQNKEYKSDSADLQTQSLG